MVTRRSAPAAARSKPASSSVNSGPASQLLVGPRPRRARLRAGTASPGGRDVRRLDRRRKRRGLDRRAAKRHAVTDVRRARHSCSGSRRRRTRLDLDRELCSAPGFSGPAGDGTVGDDPHAHPASGGTAVVVSRTTRSRRRRELLLVPVGRQPRARPARVDVGDRAGGRDLGVEARATDCGSMPSSAPALGRQRGGVPVVRLEPRPRRAARRRPARTGWLNRSRITIGAPARPPRRYQFVCSSSRSAS